MRKLLTLIMVAVIAMTTLTGCGEAKENKNGVPSSYNCAYTDETNYLVIEKGEITMNETKCEVTWVQTDLFSDREIPVVHFTYEGNLKNLYDENYATPTTEDFIVEQQIHGFNVHYFDGELISDTQIQGWSDDEYSEYLDKKHVTENEDYITSSTYSFDSNGNLVDIRVIYIFESEKMAKYYQDCCWDFDKKECSGYTLYSRKGNILTMIDEESLSSIWMNHAEDGSNYYKWDFSPSDGAYISKPDIPKEYRDNLNK